MGIELVVSGQLPTVQHSTGTALGDESLVGARLAPRAPGRPAVLRLELRRADGETAVVSVRLRRIADEAEAGAGPVPAYAEFLRDLFAPIGEERASGQIPGPLHAAVERETLRWMAAVGQQVLRIAELDEHRGSGAPVIYHQSGGGDLPVAIGWTSVVDVSDPDSRWLPSLRRCERWLSLPAMDASPQQRPRRWRRVHAA